MSALAFHNGGLGKIGDSAQVLWNLIDVPSLVEYFACFQHILARTQDCCKNCTDSLVPCAQHFEFFAHSLKS